MIGWVCGLPRGETLIRDNVLPIRDVMRYRPTGIAPQPYSGEYNRKMIFWQMGD
jgi:hypothetical protein